MSTGSTGKAKLPKSTELNSISTIDERVLMEMETALMQLMKVGKYADLPKQQ